MNINTRMRLYEEHRQLGDRIDKLQRFIYESDTFKTLDVNERADLMQQLECMQKYFTILSSRRARLSCRDEFDHDSVQLAADESVSGAAGTYPGGVVWAVRWSEVGVEPRISSAARNEDEVRGFYKHLQDRYRQMGRTDRPELLAARIHWQVQE